MRYYIHVQDGQPQGYVRISDVIEIVEGAAAKVALGQVPEVAKEIRGDVTKNVSGRLLQLQKDIIRRYAEGERSTEVDEVTEIVYESFAEAYSRELGEDLGLEDEEEENDPDLEFAHGAADAFGKALAEKADVVIENPEPDIYLKRRRAKAQ